MKLIYLFFSYMGGANFWGGTKENDVSITLNKLLMVYLSILFVMNI